MEARGVWYDTCHENSLARRGYAMRLSSAPARLAGPVYRPVTTRTGQGRGCRPWGVTGIRHH
eukprot:scaffold52988_cov68-Phaeocystis_antarctica.AAC.14